MKAPADHQWTQALDMTADEQAAWEAERQNRNDPLSLPGLNVENWAAVK